MELRAQTIDGEKTVTIQLDNTSGETLSALKSHFERDLNCFKHKNVRDLAWVMLSPSLLDSVSTLRFGQYTYSNHVVGDDFCRSLYRRKVHWLSALDAFPEPLLNWLKHRTSVRLGYYFEDLLAFWITQAYDACYFHRRVQVRDQHKTLGEFDYLFQRCGSPVLNHWEAAIKYYLRYCDEQGQYRWYGPNSHDRLDLKIERLFGHQLRLSSHPQATSSLPNSGYSRICPRAFVKGRLFYPVETLGQTPDPVPPYISAQHAKGWWTRAGVYQLPNVGSNSQWYLLSRQNWMALPYLCADERQVLLDSGQLVDYCERYFTDAKVSEQNPAIMVAELLPDEAGIYQEKSRGFIVEPRWPRHHR